MDIKQFTLKKAKTIKGGGLEIDFDIAEVIGASHYIDSKSVKSTKFIHPDLERVFLEFKPYLSANLGYDHIRQVVNNPEFKATGEQLEYAEKQYQFILDKLDVSGISIASDEKSIKILGKNSLNGQPIALNSTQLRFDTSKGYEEALQDLCEKLKDEVFEFIYNDKVSNPEIGFEDEENE